MEVVEIPDCIETETKDQDDLISVRTSKSVDASIDSTTDEVINLLSRADRNAKIGIAQSFVSRNDAADLAEIRRNFKVICD
jgi:hypothetical protein